MVEIVNQRWKHRRFGKEIAQPVLDKLQKGCTDLRWTVWTWDEYGIPYSTFQAKSGDLFVYVFWDREDNLFSCSQVSRKITTPEMLINAESALCEGEAAWTDEVDPWIDVVNILTERI